MKGRFRSVNGVTCLFCIGSWPSFLWKGGVVGRRSMGLGRLSAGSLSFPPLGSGDTVLISVVVVRMKGYMPKT